MYCERIQIDFNSDEALYIQLRNQIILGIATSRLQEGDTLPSVRQIAYSLSALIRINADKLYAMEELQMELRVILAKAVCKNITKEEVHQMVDRIYSEYEE